MWGLSHVNAPDDELIEGVAAGDQAALARIIELHGPALMRYSSHFLRSADEADEVLQDTFIRAERAIRKGVRPRQLGAWLFRITVNRCRSRKRSRWRWLGGKAAEVVIERASVQPDNSSAEWQDEINRALEELSATLREAFLLKHVEGLSYEEMAEITGAGVPALKMRVSRACDRLRDRLKDLR